MLLIVKYCNSIYHSFFTWRYFGARWLTKRFYTDLMACHETLLIAMNHTVIILHIGCIYCRGAIIVSALIF